MKMPGFSATASLSGAPASYRAAIDATPTARSVRPQVPGSRFGPTLPSCHWEKQWVVCGSPLPGYPPPMCLDWVYVCKFPGSSRGVLG
jgi:hypothetical protein